MEERIQPEQCIARPGATTWLHEQLEAATKKIDNDAIEIRRLQKQVTELQQRGSELLEDARAARREAKGLREVLAAVVKMHGDDEDATRIVRMLTTAHHWEAGR